MRHHHLHKITCFGLFSSRSTIQFRSFGIGHGIASLLMTFGQNIIIRLSVSGISNFFFSNLHFGGYWIHIDKIISAFTSFYIMILLSFCGCGVMKNHSICPYWMRMNEFVVVVSNPLTLHQSSQVFFKNTKIWFYYFLPFWIFDKFVPGNTWSETYAGHI